MKTWAFAILILSAGTAAADYNPPWDAPDDAVKYNVKVEGEPYQFDDFWGCDCYLVTRFYASAAAAASCGNPMDDVREEYCWVYDSYEDSLNQEECNSLCNAEPSCSDYAITCSGLGEYDPFDPIWQ